MVGRDRERGACTTHSSRRSSTTRASCSRCSERPESGKSRLVQDFLEDIAANAASSLAAGVSRTGTGSRSGLCSKRSGTSRSWTTRRPPRRTRHDSSSSSTTRPEPRARRPARDGAQWDGRGKHRRRGRLRRGAQVPRGAGTPTRAGRRVRRRPLGGDDVSRPRRASRGVVARSADPSPLHGAAGASRGSSRLGGRQVERHDRPARAALGQRMHGAGLEPRRRGRARRSTREANRRRCRRQSAVRRGDDLDADRRGPARGARTGAGRWWET